MKYSEPYRNALELQRLVLDKARRDDTKGAVLSGLARAFKELEELKLRLRMKPAPKAIDVSRDGSTKSKSKLTPRETPTEAP